jgi:lysophospholipase L1-like esterase
VNEDTCTIDLNKWNGDLARVDQDLTGTILPKQASALKDAAGKATGQLVMLNYYDPDQNKCPSATHYIQQLNQQLANDAQRFGVPIADVFQAFGGAVSPNPNRCTDTWMCQGGLQHSIHPTTLGYKVIAQTLEKLTGY